MKSNINGNKIEVFPTQNSRDNGKLLLEENLYNTVYRITKLNYVYDKPTRIYKIGNSNLYGVAICLPEGSESSGLKFNIHGYDIRIDGNLYIYFMDENDAEALSANPDVVIVHSADYGEDLSIGLVLSKMASSPHRLKGDKLYNGEYFYFGVDFAIGTEFDSAPDEWKLKLGTLTLYKDDNDKANLSSLHLDFNELIIDGKYVMIKDGDNYYSLNEHLKGNYVAKSGNNYDDSGEIIHDTDVYGSMMFRDDKDSEDYRMQIGFDENHNSINIKSPHSKDKEKGITIDVSATESASSETDYCAVSLDGFKLISRIKEYSPSDVDVINLTYSSVDPEDYNRDNQFGIATKLFVISPNNEIVEDAYTTFHTESNNIFGTIFDEEKVEFIYNRDSLIQIRCDELISRISFGEYETTPIFIDYDLENHNLSINDKLGSIGVVKFCDGQCVDESDYYKSHDHSSDKPYNYTNNHIPKAYSEVLTSGTSGDYSTVLNFADAYPSCYENTKLNNDRGEYRILKDSEEYYIYTANEEDSNTEIRTVEVMYGFYVSKDWANDKYFHASAGAFDFDEVGGEVVSITEKSGHEYVDFPIEASDYSAGPTETRKSYDYITLRFKIPESLHGKKILLSEGYSHFDYFNYFYFDPDIYGNYPYDEGYNGIIDTNKMNAYFCTDRDSSDPASSAVNFGYDTQYPKTTDTPNVYTLVESTKQDGTAVTLFNFEDLCRDNCIINVPNIVGRTGDLYLVISLPMYSVLDRNVTFRYARITDQGVGKTIILYNHFLQPDLSISGGNWSTRGFDGQIKSIRFGINPKKYLVDNDDVESDYTVTQFTDTSNNTIIQNIPQTGLNSMIYSYGSSFKFNYTTSKTYKSYRIHGYYDAVQIGTAGTRIPSIPSESEVGYGEDYTYQYKCYRFIYELGFEQSDIVIEKITNITFDGISVPVMYKLSRKDGKKIVHNACTPYWFQKPNQMIYPDEERYFYVNDLKKPSVFLSTDTNYNSGSTIITETQANENIYNNYHSSTFYNRSAGNLGKYALYDYSSEPGPTGDSIWFIRNFTVIHGAGINFNVGQNKFNVNVEAYLNEVAHVSKIMFSEIDELGTTITADQARFTFESDETFNNKTIYKSITMNAEGLTFEGNPDDSSDSDVLISKVAEEATEQVPDPFNGLDIDGDLRATRVFNAVYNDYADNLKCSTVSECEPGDIISKEPGTDEYVKSTYDLRHLVIGVYSDTYGHLLGGDANKSMSENARNYVPVALAGNVKVKIIGFARAGDLVEASNIPGVGQVAKNPQIGTIIGKLLEDKDTYEIDRVLMQVMLL